MADISEFARRAARQFRDSQRSMQRRFKLKLPLRVVEEFVKNAYYASLIPDEGRYPAVCLMSYQGGDREFNFRFDPPLPPTPAEIAKVAHAAAPGVHIGCVSDNGRLLIAGLQVTMLDELRQFGYSSFRLASPLKVLILGPGHVEVSTGGTALIYKAGDIPDEELLQHSDVMHELATEVAQQFAGRTRGRVESIEDIFNDVVEGIKKLGHGGMLLVAKKADLKQFSSARRLHCGLLHQLLLRYWDDVATLNEVSGGVTNLLSGENRRATGPESLTVASDVTMLENCVSSIGHLAGMDGAIVMDYACNVVAFNAIISKAQGKAAQARLVDRIDREQSEDTISLGRGSRHQSALAYVRRVPHSFAFVISQDGGVSAFHNRGNGTVLCERGLRVLE
jgi:hypothetical protein